MFRSRPLISTLVAAAASALALSAPSAAQAAACDRVASPSPGAAQQLANSLTAGQTGCLRAGTYVEDVKVTRGGRPGQPITIRNVPGEKATLKGRLWVAKGADSVTFEQLHLNGTNSRGLPSPNVNAADTVFRNNDITNDNTAICFNLGASSYDNDPIYGRAVRTIIDSNRIHHCGRLPATNHDHGIYIEASDDARITNNWIYENADRGIQIYPDARNTTIDHNVIDRNGQGIIFGGDGGLASTGNTVTNNAITNSKIRNNVESWWNPNGPKGTNNTATNNCVSGGRRDTGNGGIDTSDGGFTITNTTTTAPTYRNTTTRDYRINTGPCAGKVRAARMAGPTLPGAVERLVRLKVSLSARPRSFRRGRAVRLAGRVRGLESLAQASTTRSPRVTILRRVRGQWRKVATVPVRADGSFKGRRKISVGTRNRAVRLRAVVNGKARSKSIRLRIAKR